MEVVGSTEEDSGEAFNGGFLPLLKGRRRRTTKMSNQDNDLWGRLQACSVVFSSEPRKDKW